MWQSIQYQILQSLGIKASRKKLFLLTISLVFILGSAQCYLIAVPYALFLTKFDAQSLPQIYLLVSLIGLSIGFLYTFLEPRISIKTILVGLILLIAFIAIFFWLMLVITQSSAIIFLLL